MEGDTINKTPEN